MIVLICFLVLVRSQSALDVGPESTFRGKIIGGRVVPIEEYAYQVSLRYMGNHICGASILSQKHVITAAHCTQGMNPKFLSIQCGITALDDTNGQIILVESIYQHPQSNLALMDYDLSILKLAEDVELSERAFPIDIIGSNRSLVGEEGVVTGWGVIREDGGVPNNNLQAVAVPILDQDSCKQKYEGVAVISPRMFCAEDPNGGRDACQGDSGGPFAVDGELVGVVSWGLGCGKAKYPGVYANITAMRSFVRQVMES